MAELTTAATDEMRMVKDYCNRQNDMKKPKPKRCQLSTRLLPSQLNILTLLLPTAITKTQKKKTIMDYNFFIHLKRPFDTDSCIVVKHKMMLTTIQESVSKRRFK